MAPLAATAGRPIPGKVESPQHMRPGIGVNGPERMDERMDAEVNSEYVRCDDQGKNV